MLRLLVRVVGARLADQVAVDVRITQCGTTEIACEIVFVATLGCQRARQQGTERGAITVPGSRQSYDGAVRQASECGVVPYGEGETGGSCSGQTERQHEERSAHSHHRSDERDSIEGDTQVYVFLCDGHTQR